jgi:hypothetical protein
MAFATTTLSAAVTATAKEIVVASATSVAAGRLVLIGREMMQVTKGYVAASTTVPVLRGQGGTASRAHPTTATVIHGDATDFQTAGAQAVTGQPAARPWKTESFTGTPNTFVLPAGGENVHVILNGTTADTFTVPVPTADMNGTFLLISSNGVAQHLLTFTGGVCGAGASYDVITVNAAAPASFLFVAVDSLWHSVCGAAIGGTTTNIAGTIA